MIENTTPETELERLFQAKIDAEQKN